MPTYYVDPDVVGGAGDGSTWANAYSSLNAAEQARDTDITGAGPTTFLCGHNGSGNTSADATAVIVAGWTTTAADYIAISTESANRAGTSFNTSKYRIYLANSAPLSINENYVRVDGLQLGKSSSNASNVACVAVNTIDAGGSDIRLSGLYCQQPGNASSYTEPGFSIADADATVTIWNSISVGGQPVNSNASAACYVSGGTVAVYGCTLGGGYRGLFANNAAAVVTAKNCYAYGSSAAYATANSGSLTQTTCAASDTTATDATLDNIAWDTSNFTSVTSPYDMALPSGSDLIGVGTTLTDDPPGSTALGVDIAGTSRTVTWDIGAFEFIAAAKALLPRFMPYRLWTRRYN